MTPEIQTVGNLKNGLAFGNHGSVAKYGGEVRTKVATEVALGRAIVFPVTQAKEIVELRISPIGVVEGKEKL